MQYSIGRLRNNNEEQPEQVERTPVAVRSFQLIIWENYFPKIALLLWFWESRARLLHLHFFALRLLQLTLAGSRWFQFVFVCFC